jgi:hypothetical protein
MESRTATIPKSVNGGRNNRAQVIKDKSVRTPLVKEQKQAFLTETSPAVSTSSPERPKETTEERAYRIWEMNGRPHGKDMEFWLQAETELGILPSP